MQQQQVNFQATYNLKTQVNAVTILAVANTLLGGLLLVAVMLILCIMCASERTLGTEKAKSEAEERMDEAFPTIFTRMRRQASRLIFWRKWKRKPRRNRTIEEEDITDTTDQVIADEIGRAHV